jgi:hypothetical protein
VGNGNEKNREQKTENGHEFFHRLPSIFLVSHFLDKKIRKKFPFRFFNQKDLWMQLGESGGFISEKWAKISWGGLIGG